MSKIRHERRMDAAGKAALQLHACETSVEASLREMGRFLATLPDLRADSQVALTFGHEVYAEFAGLYQSQVETHGRLVRAHKALDQARVDLNLPEVSTMYGADKPKFVTAFGPHLVPEAA